MAMGRARHAPPSVAAASAALLAACPVGTNYSRPAVPTPLEYRFFEGEAEAQAIAELPWWDVVEGPVLPNHVREAIANNLDLPASLLERRPDVLGAEHLLVAANSDVGAAKALSSPPSRSPDSSARSAVSSRTS